MKEKLDEINPLIKDKLDGRRPSMENNIKVKMTFECPSDER